MKKPKTIYGVRVTEHNEFNIDEHFLLSKAVLEGKGELISNCSIHNYLHNYTPGMVYHYLFDGVQYTPYYVRHGEYLEYEEYHQSCERQGITPVSISDYFNS